ncbi:hypothetical protein HELRODRAFT_136002, partial [Helobdella robusta]|uniref:Superoxide dismutase [Cu-Zn] n=1 Tax=Helobdella robusta TaxID=6412 RepID=T1EIB5_HELRO
RHVGDLGNINAINGASVITLTDNIIKLDGQYGIVNRSIVVHQLEDDLGKGNSTFSNTTGNAGGRLGCCTI